MHINVRLLLLQIKLENAGVGVFFFLAGITLLNYKLRRKVCVTAKDTKVLPNKLLNIKSITKLPGFIVLRLSKGENAKEEQQCEKKPFSLCKTSSSSCSLQICWTYKFCSAKLFTTDVKDHYSVRISTNRGTIPALRLD